MNICVANRDNIVFSHFKLDELKEAGVTAIELYVPATDGGFQANDLKIQEVTLAGLEPIVHLTDVTENWTLDYCLASLLAKSRVTRIILHPVESDRGQEGDGFRTMARLRHILENKKFSPPLGFFLENLPLNSAWPERYGVDLMELASKAAELETAGLHCKLCLDTGHHLGWSPGQNFVSLSLPVARRVGHIHVHAFVDGQDHRPLVDDDGQLAELIREFRYFRPSYRGYWSVEIIPFDHDPRKAVLGSIAQLQTWLA